MRVGRRATADAKVAAGVDALSFERLCDWHSLRDYPELAAAIEARMPLKRRTEELSARKQTLAPGNVYLLAQLSAEQRVLDDEVRAANRRVDAATDAALALVKAPLVAEFHARLGPLAEAVDALRVAAESVREIEDLASRFMTNGGNYVRARGPLSSTSLGSQIVARCEQFAFALRQHRSK